MNQIYDVTIVGGGPAGSLLAHKLASFGLKVIILEKNKVVRRKVCGEYLCPLGVELLQRENIEVEVLDTFLPLTGMLIVTSKGTEVTTNFPMKHRYHGVSVNRELFDKNLLLLAKKSGAELQMGVEVKDITQHAEQWLVQTNIGTLVSRIVIGADGRGSVVSKRFENDVANAGKRVALHAYVANDSKNIRLGEMHLFKDGEYIGLNPTEDNEVNLSLVLDAEVLKKLGGPIPAFNHYLKMSSNLSSRFKLFDSNDKVGAAFPIQHRTKSITPARNIALIGDAAGFVDPLTGEGMYNALLSAKLLADEIIQQQANKLSFQDSIFIKYKKAYNKVLREKIILNRGFQTLIKYPLLVEIIAKFLKSKPIRADIFIGIIGNIYSPLKGFFKLFFYSWKA